MVSLNSLTESVSFRTNTELVLDKSFKGYKLLKKVRRGNVDEITGLTGRYTAKEMETYLQGMWMCSHLTRR